AGPAAWAEDPVQPPRLRALSSWPFKGVPDKPAAWLAVVARNRALDLLRPEGPTPPPHAGAVPRAAAGPAVVARNRALDLLRPGARTVPPDDEAFPVEPQQPASDGHFDRELNDDELALLFAVCHPALSPEMRVTL